MIYLVRELRGRLWLWWWNLWTGDANEAATRSRLEHEVRRFGGEVRWPDENWPDDHPGRGPYRFNEP